MKSFVFLIDGVEVRNVCALQRAAEDGPDVS